MEEEKVSFRWVWFLISIYLLIICPIQGERRALLHNRNKELQASISHQDHLRPSKSPGSGVITDGYSRKGYILPVPEISTLHNGCKIFFRKSENYTVSRESLASIQPSWRLFQLFWFEKKVCFRCMFFLQ